MCIANSDRPESGRTGASRRQRQHHHEGQEHGADRDGELIRRARRYEWTARVGMLGRRRQVYDGLVALSEIGPGDRGQAGFALTGSGDRWPALHYVQARRPAVDVSAAAEGSRP